MAMNLKFTLFCLTTVYLLGSCTLADDQDKTLRELLGNLEKFKPTINSSLERVVETMRKNRQAARAAKSALKTGQVASLQKKIDKVGKLLGIVADLIWDRLYFATDGGKIMVHSLETGDTKSVVENPKNPDGFYGITYDPEKKKMYFSSSHAIYRANLDGSDLEMVTSDMKYKRMSGLAFDWIGRNLYGVSWAGIVFACKERVEGKMECHDVWKEQGQLEGIVLDPNNGTMYWTAPGKIMKSNMDGSEAEVFVKGLEKPFGLVIDRKTNELVSTDPVKNEIKATKLDTKGVRWHAGGSPKGVLRGVAFDDEFGCLGAGGSIICGQQPSETRFFPSTDVYSGDKQINHLFMPGFKYTYDRYNSCNEVPACTTICLLKPNNSSSCLQ